MRKWSATLRHAGVLFGAIMILFVANPILATESDILYVYGRIFSDGPYDAPGLASDYCMGGIVTGKTASAVGPVWIAQHNSITSNTCWSTCRNPATFTGANDATFSFTLVSNCTGANYSVTLQQIRAPKQPYCSNTSAGNPCDVAAQAKIQTEVDYRASGQLGLSFSRIYNSRFQLNTGGSTTVLGPGWRTNFDRSTPRVNGTVVASSVGPNIGTAQVTLANGQVLSFTYSGATGTWNADPDISQRLEQRVDSSGNHAGWIFRSGTDNSYEVYDTTGKLTALVDNDGMTQSLLYGSSDGLLQSVTDAAGRNLAFTYSNGRLATLTQPDGQSISYSYDANGYLYRVTTPDTHFREYHYAKSVSYNGTNDLLLTSLIDENSNTYATWDYDTAGRPTLSVHGDPTGSIDRTTIAYPTPDLASVTSPLGATTQFTFVDQLGMRKFGTLSAPCPSCGAQYQAQTYDSSGYPQSRTDFNGRATNFTYDDTRGLETQRIEASGTSSQRTTNTTWNANLRVPDSRSVLNASNATESLTKWSYNTRGQVLSRCEVDPAVSGALSYTCGSQSNAPLGVRQNSYTYCEQAGVSAGTCPLVGLILSANGPRTDVSDVTTYTYYQATDLSGCAIVGGACHYKGDLLQVTNALGQNATYISYDKNGRVTRQSDANGTSADFTYHPRGWLLTRTVRANADGSASSNDATTTFDYDNVGQVKKITQPDGAYLAYTYDAAHRLTDITDNLSNTIHYTLDAAGNRKQEDTKDPSGTLKRTLSRQYDQLNRLTKNVNAAGATVQQYINPAEAPPSGITYTNGYDGNGNAVYSVDGNSVGTEQQYDPLNRLVKTLQDHAGTGATKDTTTQYAYDARDNLRSVSDPDSLITNYTYDGLNNLTQLQSPDTGSSSYTYDAAGNRKTQTDSRGIITSYSYDALNRLTSVSYPTSSLNVAYRYDEPDSTTGCSGSAPIGRLTTMTDSSGSTTYCYDNHGNLAQTTQAVDGQSLNTQYIYSVADRLNFLIYPSGDVVGYDRDAAGRTVAVTFMAGDPMPLVSNVSYSPFGPANTITFANGRTLTKTYDQDYAISMIASSDSNGLALTAQVDALGNLTRATLPSATRAFGYDPLYRLTSANDGNNVSVESYTYNLTGDRTNKTLSGASQTYAYTAPLTSHRLQSVAGSGRTYDATGNTTQIGSTTFTYDDRNRLSAASGAAYLYNGKGERVVKRIGTQDTIFAYGPSGNLLAEYASPFSCNNPNFFNCDPNFNGLSWPTEYLWLDGTLIGVVRNGNPYYVETDQLGSPRNIIQPGYPSNDPVYGDKVVWSWGYAASTFGENAPNQDPSNSGNAFVMNLRFPGQYYDTETGLNFNNARYYDSSIGRYISSDPIGLAGAIATYPYTDSNSLIFIDPSGLEKRCYWVPEPGQYAINTGETKQYRQNGQWSLIPLCIPWGPHAGAPAPKDPRRWTPWDFINYTIRCYRVRLIRLSDFQQFAIWQKGKMECYSFDECNHMTYTEEGQDRIVGYEWRPNGVSYSSEMKFIAEMKTF